MFKMFQKRTLTPSKPAGKCIIYVNGLNLGES